MNGHLSQPVIVVFFVLETENTCVFINAFGFCFGDLPGGSDGKEFACNAGEQGSIPGLGRSPREGKGYSLQYSCLGNPVDRQAWRATVHRVKKRSARLSMISLCIQSFEIFALNNQNEMKIMNEY